MVPCACATPPIFIQQASTSHGLMGSAARLLRLGQPREPPLRIRHARLQLLRELCGLDEAAPEAAEQPAEVRTLRPR